MSRNNHYRLIVRLILLACVYTLIDFVCFIFFFFLYSLCSCTLIMTARLVASVRYVWQVANWIWTFAEHHVRPPQHWTHPFGQSIRMEMLYRHYHRHKAAAATTMYRRHTMKAKNSHQWRQPVSDILFYLFD